MNKLIILSFIALASFMGIAEAKNVAYEVFKMQEKVNNYFGKNLTPNITQYEDSEMMLPDGVRGTQIVSCAVFGVHDFTCAYFNVNTISFMTDATYTDPESKNEGPVCLVGNTNTKLTDANTYTIAFGTCKEFAKRLKVALGR